MDKNSSHYKQVSLLVQTLPYIARESCFALKGGTAINLFVRDFPRLSVDIDLVYLPFEPRDSALVHIKEGLRRISDQLNQQLALSAVLQDGKPDEMRIIVESSEAQIKIEVSPMADLYGGKLCAALGRQHPRDLFDVKLLLEATGVERDVFDGFITYALCHSRPIAEIFAPNWRNISEGFYNELYGMAKQAITAKELADVPFQMLKALKANFTPRDHHFIMSFKSGKPDWEYAPNERI